MSEKSLNSNEKALKILRMIGFPLIIIGLVCMIVGFVNFANGNTKFFYLLFIGVPLFPVGLMMVFVSYMRVISAFTASQTASVRKDVANYMLDGTRDEVVKTFKAASDKTIICPKGHKENEFTARFCSMCGNPLVKKCPHCDELNDMDAKYCKKCGKEL